jgi:glutamate racemase
MAPIGVFDSGVGGLSVLREIRAQLPHEDLVYAADSGHLPYGTKPPAFVQQRALAIARHLIDREGAKLIVVACNTATAHAIDLLRQTVSVPIVGIEPAIKPAAVHSRTGVVGVLATDGTLEGDRFASLVERFGEDVEVVTQPCPHLVEEVEAGRLSGPETEAILRRYTADMLERGADVIVLGCTHYPFLTQTLRRVVGDSVTLIDPAAAVALQTKRVLRAHGIERSGADDRAGRVRFLTTGDLDAGRSTITRLWQEPVGAVERLPV